MARNNLAELDPRRDDPRLETFAAIFGRYPLSAANHTGLAEGIYWADKRLTGVNALAYNLLTGWRNRGVYWGEMPGNRFFWGDVCRERIKYYRNFVFEDVNTIKTCPLMPYHDARRPLVRNWFAASNGVDCDRFNRCLSEQNQDRLEEESGACVMYTHFAFRFMQNGRIEPRFRKQMERLAKKDGWFAPVGDAVGSPGLARAIRDQQRRARPHRAEMVVRKS